MELSGGTIMKKQITGVLIGFSVVLASVTAYGQELTFDHVYPKGGRAEIDVPDNYKEVTQEEFDDMDRAMRAFTPANDSLLKNNAKEFYYYSQLNENQQALYDCLMQLTDYPDQEDNFSLFFSEIDPSSDEFMEEVFIVYLAMTYDHPELFWLYNSSRTSPVWGSVAGGEGENPFYMTMFSLSDPYVDYEKEVTAFNEAVEDFLSDIDRNTSEEEIVRQIHDKLVRLVTYDYSVADGASSSGSDLAHSAYGALVMNSSGNSNYAVCDGYALAFEYLLQQVGIECAFVGGSAGNSEADMGGHAWNIVKINGEWYEIDSTWDDVGGLDDALEMLDKESLEYKCFSEALHDDVYRDVLEHYMFGKTTDELRYYYPGEDEYYTTMDQEYYFTLLYPSVHVRDNEVSSEMPMGILSALAPNAVNALG